jgi:hypothetical protein
MRLNITWKQWEWLKHISRPVRNAGTKAIRKDVGSNKWVHIHHIEAVDRLNIDALVLEGLVERRKQDDRWADEWRVVTSTFSEWFDLLDTLDIDDPTDKDLNNFE